MVYQNDGSQESRPPTLEDLLDLCRKLNARKAKYIVIGGMAMVEHGFVRATEDIDLLIEASVENEKRVLEVISELPDGAAKEIKQGEIAEFEVIRVADEIVVDLMAKAGGLSYRDAEAGIEKIKIEDVEIPFAGVDLLIKLKQSVRLKDQMDLQFLKALKSKK